MRQPLVVKSQRVCLSIASWQTRINDVIHDFSYGNKLQILCKFKLGLKPKLMLNVQCSFNTSHTENKHFSWFIKQANVMNVNSLVLIHLLKYSLDSILSREEGKTSTRISEHTNLCQLNPQHIPDSNLYIMAMRVKSLHKQKAFLSHSGTFLFAMLLKRYNRFFC